MGGASPSSLSAATQTPVLLGDEYQKGCDGCSLPTIRDFELEAVIGMGGFGKVWRARHRTSGERYAIKIQNVSKIRHQPQKLAQARAEREILKAMGSPFIVKLHWALENHNSVFLVLDLIPNGTLFQLQSKQPNMIFTEHQTAFYIMETFLGLAHLHKNHVCYRDLKPENLLIDQQGHVVLTDFGLSALISDDDRRRSVLGTPEYMAPVRIPYPCHVLHVLSARD